MKRFKYLKYSDIQIMAKGFGISIPDIAIYGVLAYIAITTLKPVATIFNDVAKPITAASNLATDVINLPSTTIKSMTSGNFQNYVQGIEGKWLNFMFTGIPKTLGVNL
jgi:hypothetical protein